MNTHNIFYSNGSMITDISGKKTKEQAADEFSWNLDSMQNIEIDSTSESTKIVDGSLVKYNYIEENTQMATEEKEKKESKIASVKDKLNLSEEDWNNLKEALR